MIPYLLALAGGYLLGKSIQSESFADGGTTSAKEYQIKKPDGTYFYLKMSTGNAGWAESADMGYQYTQEEAEKVKERLEKEGHSGLSVVKYDKDWWKNAPNEFADGGSTDSIAMTILKQLGGAGRLNAMTGAYNFRDLGNGLAFKIKNQRANYIKITLNGMDLYDLEVGRTRGTTYKVVASHDNVYFDQLKPLIEKATGMYLSLFAKGGKTKKKYAILRSRMGEIIADIEVETEDRLDALKQFIDLGIDVNQGTIYFTDTPPHYYAEGGEIKWQDVEVGDSARVKDINKSGVIVKTYGRKFHLKFVDGTEKTYDANELEFTKN